MANDEQQAKGDQGSLAVFRAGQATRGQRTRDPAARWWVKAEAGDLWGAVLAYVEQFDYASFAELQQRLGAFFQVRGHVALTHPDDPNLLLWGSMSEALAAAVGSLVEGGR